MRSSLESHVRDHRRRQSSTDAAGSRPPAEILGGLDACGRPATATSPRSPTRSARSMRCSQGLPGAARARRRDVDSSRRSRLASTSSTRSPPTSSAGSTPTTRRRRARRRRARGGERRPDRAARRAVGDPPRPPPHGRRRRRARRPRRRRRHVRRLPRRSSRRCRRSTGWRCAAATRPGCTCSCGTTTSIADAGGGGAARRARRRPAVPVAARSASSAACLSFVYKAAAEIGELGDNTAAMRAAVVDDDPAAPGGRRRRRARWRCSGTPAGRASASSREPNAHPVNSDEIEQPGGARPPYVVAVLNGDVDNHADLRVEHGLRIAGPITTDAKVIPTLVAPSSAPASISVEAFRRTVAAFEGSVAIGDGERRRARHAVPRPQRQRPGRCTSASPTTATSSPASRTAWSRRRARTSASTASTAARSWSLDATRAGTLDGIRRVALRRHRRCPVDAGDVVTAEVTTRDIDRGDVPHFLLKEITESPDSFAKTLRGKIVERDGLLPRRGRRRRPAARASPPGSPTVRSRRIRVIGQGTAAVAGQSMATCSTS